MPRMAGTESHRIAANHRTQGCSLLCHGVILFEDGGELLPDGCYRLACLNRLGL